jgi:hypothetical protein
MTSLRRIGTLLVLLPLTAATACTTTTIASAPSRHPIAATAKRWQLVRYRGVQVRIPATWPVINGIHADPCDVFRSGPIAFLGPTYGDPSCPAGLSKPALGLWLQPGVAPSDTHPAKIAPGTTVAEMPEVSNFKQFWYHQVQILIGVRRDPRLTNAIIASVRYIAGAPDTKAAGNCPRVADSGSMPKPRRLSRRMVVDQGTTTLAPPPASARPTTSAARAWREAGSKVPFDRYRIFLTLYSSKYPATPNANGSTTPLDHDVLAWVIYATPATAATAPGVACGGWQLIAYDARTGQGIISSGYGPGT